MPVSERKGTTTNVKHELLRSERVLTATPLEGPDPSYRSEDNADQKDSEDKAGAEGDEGAFKNFGNRGTMAARSMWLWKDVVKIVQRASGDQAKAEVRAIQG
jgi:hypothetical protein